MSGEDIRTALLRQEIEELLRATEGAAADKDAGTGYWHGDVAGKRQVMDDMQSGVFHWTHAHRTAKLALAFLEKGEIEVADAALAHAKALAAAAIEARMQPKDYADLSKPARRRGAKLGSAERNRLIDEAVTAAEARGVVGTPAYKAAQRAHPELKGMSVKGMSKARERWRARSRQRLDQQSPPDPKEEKPASMTMEEFDRWLSGGDSKT